MGDGSDVGQVAVGAEADGFSKRCLNSVEGDGCLVQLALGRGQLPADPLLLSLEQVERDGIGVVGLDELQALVLKGLDSLTLALLLGLGFALFGSQLRQQGILGGRQ